MVIYSFIDLSSSFSCAQTNLYVHACMHDMASFPSTTPMFSPQTPQLFTATNYGFGSWRIGLFDIAHQRKRENKGKEKEKKLIFEESDYH